MISRMPGARGDFIFDENFVGGNLAKKHSDLGSRHALIAALISDS